MSYTTPSTGRGSTYAPTAAIWNSEIVANLDHLKYTGARKYNPTQSTHASGSWVGCGSMTQSWDTDSLSTSAASGKMNVPAGLAGLWALDVRGVWKHPSTSYGWVAVRSGLNGSTSSTSVLALKPSPRNNSNSRRAVSASWIFNLSSGDYVLPNWYHQTGGGGLDIAHREVHFHWLGPSTKSTAWPTITHSSVGDRVTSTDWNNAAARTKWLAARPVAHVTRTSTYNIAASNTWYDLNFPTEQFDPWGMHSTAANTSRVTVGRSGLYRIIGRTMWSSGSTRHFKMAVQANGSGERHYLDTDENTADRAGAGRRLMGQHLMWLNRNEYVELSIASGSTARGLATADLFVEWRGDQLA